MCEVLSVRPEKKVRLWAEGCLEALLYVIWSCDGPGVQSNRLIVLRRAKFCVTSGTLLQAGTTRVWCLYIFVDVLCIQNHA